MKKAHYNREKRTKLAQNYLKNPAQVRYLVEKARIASGDTVLEVGPGRGIITSALIDVGATVYAIEKDEGHVNELKSTASSSNLHIFASDALTFKRQKHVKTGEYKVFSNPPFNISSKLIKKYLLEYPMPSEAYVILQADAAERFMGYKRKGRTLTKRHNLLSTQLSMFYDMNVFYRFKPSDFSPAPKGRVVMVSFTSKKPAKELVDHIEGLQSFLEYGFSEPILPLEEKFSAQKARKYAIEASVVKEFCKQHRLAQDAHQLQLTPAQWRDLFFVYKGMRN